MKREPEDCLGVGVEGEDSTAEMTSPTVVLPGGCGFARWQRKINTASRVRKIMSLPSRTGDLSVGENEPQEEIVENDR